MNRLLSAILSTVRSCLCARRDLIAENLALRQHSAHGFETDFYYYGRIGFSYRFGSKFANVVNPRMGGGGGGMIIMY